MLEDTEQSNSFGGVIPDDNAGFARPDQDLISLEDPKPAPDLITLKTDGDRPALQGKVAEQRAAKTNFALGADSPGLESITNDLKAGQEDALRQRLADQKDVQDRITKMQVIKDKAQGGDLSPESVKQMEDVTKFSPKNDPSTIIEKYYADTLTNAYFGLGNSVGMLSKSFTKDPRPVVHSADVAADLIMRQEIAKSAAEDMAAQYKDSDWFGWGYDQLRSWVPGYTAVKLWDAKVPSDSYFKGGTIGDKVSWYYTLSPKDMHDTLREDLRVLSKTNKSLAHELADAVVHYSSEDRFFDNLSTGFDIATAVPVGAIGKSILKGVAKGAIERQGAKDAAEAAAAKAGTAVADDAAKAAGESSHEAGEAYKDLVKANATMETDAGNVLTAVGDIEKGAQANAMKRTSEIFGSDPLGEGRDLSKEMNLLTNPEMIAKGGSGNVSAAYTQRIIDSLKRNVDAVMSKVSEQVKVGRLPEEALQVAFKEAGDNVRDRYQHIADAIVDVRHNLPEKNDANVGSVTAVFGRRDGTLFDSLLDANQIATQDYKLTPGSFQIKQKGQHWQIEATQHIDETSQGVRDALLTTENTTRRSLSNSIFGFVRSAADRLPVFQQENRLTAVHGHSNLQAVFKDMLGDIGKLSKGEQKDLNRIMAKNKYEMSTIEKKNGEIEEIRGQYYDTVEDLQKSYQETLKRLPTEAEAKAYFTFRQLNDIDWTVRNLGVFRDRARQGLREFNLFDLIEGNTPGRMFDQKSKNFNGKFVDSLPFENKEDAGVVIHTKGSEPRYLRKSAIDADPALKKEIEDLQASGAKIIQTENPVEKHFGEKFGNERVNFIVTKDAEDRAINWKQIPYRPGWHTEYAQNWYVKQPVIRKAGEEGAVRHVYEGDTAAMGFNTQAEARKYAERMDTARELLKAGKGDELDTFLRGNLPFEPKEFRRLFQENEKGEVAFSLNEPFLHTFTGKNTADEANHLNKLKSSYEGFEDNVRSSYNLFQNTDKKFIGRRDNPLWTVQEKGSELNPIYNVINAPEVDPMQSVSSAMSNVMRSRFFSDYKTQAVEQWVKDFGHLLAVDPHDLANNPTFHVHNPVFKPEGGNNAEIRAAKNSRNALLELVGTKGDVEMAIDGVQQQALEGIYNRLGQKWSDRLAPVVLQGEKDPIKLMRGFAFHTGIGMFNPMQLVQNMATMTHTLALSPVHGLSSSAITPLIRYAMVNDNGIERLAQIASKVGYGKPEQFKEMLTELKRSGKLTVEGEHTWNGDLGEPKLFNGKMGNVLDAGLFFFKEGERTSRLSAYATAYREWRAANPEGVINDAVRRGLINRSDDLTANMTRASNAAWQQGVFSVPAQFMSYHTRIAEQMLGNRLTGMEKVRAMATYSAIWGLPIGTLGSMGAGALGAGQVQPWESVRNYALENGIQLGDNFDAAVHGGLVDLAATMLAGERMDVSSKLGPTGGQAISNLLSGDKSMLETMFGASGSKAAAVATAFGPVANWLAAPIRGDDAKFPLKSEDVMAILRNSKTIDSGVNLYYGLNAGKIFGASNTETGTIRDKSGALVRDGINPTEAVMAFMTGAVPRDVSDAQLILKLNKNRDAAVQAATKQMGRDFSSQLNAAEAGDMKMAQDYQQRIATMSKLAGLTPDEQKQVFTQFVQANTSRINKIKWDFVYKNAPPEQAQARQENDLKQRELRNNQ